MLFKEPKIEPAFERYRDLFERIVEEEVQELEKCGHSIGEGRTAKVKVSDVKDFICLKIIDYRQVRKNSVNLTNKANEEMEFLDKLSDIDFLKSIGINQRIVPRPMYSQNSSNFGFIFMQKINGFTIKDWREGGCKAEALPAGFNWQQYFDQLEDIIDKLNNANIHHRDFHDGNIFVDDKGHPIIIDFGNARETFLSDEAPYREDDFRGGTTVYSSDKKMLSDIKKNILK